MVSNRTTALIALVALLLGAGGTYAWMASLAKTETQKPSPTVPLKEKGEMEVMKTLEQFEKSAIVYEFTPDIQFFYTFPIIARPNAADYAKFFTVAKTLAVKGATINFTPPTTDQVCAPKPLVLSLKKGAELTLYNGAPANITVTINNVPNQIKAKSGVKFKWDFGPVGTVATYSCNEENKLGDVRGYVYVTE